MGLNDDTPKSHPHAPRGACAKFLKCKRRTGEPPIDLTEDEREYDTDKGQTVTLGTRAANLRRAQTADSSFRSTAPRIPLPKEAKSHLCPGEYFALETHRGKIERSFARRPDGSPQGSASFESHGPRIKLEHRDPGGPCLDTLTPWAPNRTKPGRRPHSPVTLGEGFPRPMLNMDVEEARSGWNNPDRGFTTADSDRWKGGVFDMMGGAPAGRVPFKAKGMADRLEHSMMKHSAMRPGTDRVTTNPTAMTMPGGTRAGSTVAVKASPLSPAPTLNRSRPSPETLRVAKAPDPKLGPGTYNVVNGNVSETTKARPKTSDRWVVGR